VLHGDIGTVLGDSEQAGEQTDDGFVIRVLDQLAERRGAQIGPRRSIAVLQLAPPPRGVGLATNTCPSSNW